MASIIKRNNNFCVVYSYKDANGTPKQKWETFTDLSDAKNRKKEVEYKESVGTFVVPQCKTLNDLLPEYVALYGKSKWALSTYQANTALIANYIAPLIGSMKLQDITTRVIEGYYQRLLKYEAADPMCGKRKHQFVSPSTVRSVHKILRSAFEQAVKWELMEKNPCIYATLPKYTSKKRDIWTAETLFRALKVCDDPKLRLCINLSFSCSLRLGELLGLTWDCIDFTNGTISVRQQARQEQKKGGQYYFSTPKNGKGRVLAVPQSVLTLFRAQQDKQKEMAAYAGTAWDNVHNLVFTNAAGSFLSHRTVYDCFKRIVKSIGMETMLFRDLRHSYAVASIKNGDDIKTVQENLGHATAAFTLDVYVHATNQMKKASADRMEQYIQTLQGE